MQCLSPITLKSDNAHLAHSQIVPCGKCVCCLEKKRAQWSIRLREELRDSTNAVFLTLTYSPENLPFDEDTGEVTLNKKHLQGFFKRLRSEVDYSVKKIKINGKTAKNGIRFKYFAQGEYGSLKDRPHYHAIIFNLPEIYHREIEKIWGNGFIRFDSVNDAVIHYCTKYMISKYDEAFEDRVKPFALMSKGLGAGYIQRNTQYHKDTQTAVYTALGGEKFVLPRYYRDKIFSKDQSLYLGAKNKKYALNQLNKNDEQLRSSVNSDHEFFATKHERVSRYSEARMRYLNKNNKL